MSYLSVFLPLSDVDCISVFLPLPGVDCIQGPCLSLYVVYFSCEGFFSCKIFKQNGVKGYLSQQLPFFKCLQFLSLPQHCISCFQVTAHLKLLSACLPLTIAPLHKIFYLYSYSVHLLMEELTSICTFIGKLKYSALLFFHLLKT